jgi:hypothetical protein
VRVDEHAMREEQHPGAERLDELPLASNSRIGSRALPAQLLAPHRSAIQMWPRLSTATALDEPMVRPAGSLKNPASAT